MTAALLILTAALLATLRAAHRLLRQRDAERLRADLRYADAARREASMTRREQMLLDDLDFACAEAVSLRERMEQLGYLVLAAETGRPLSAVRS